MERFQSKTSLHEISYCVFDVIYYKGDKITSLPLITRKRLLAEIIPEETPLITKVKWIEGNGSTFFNLVKQQDLEGIVLKKADSKYQIDKRSHDWLKVINYKYDTVYISGLRKDEFGLLLSFENGKTAGILEFVKPEARKQFYKVYRELIIKENDKFIYLDPKIRCKIKYRNLTKNGLLRIPSFLEWAN
jgi:DNA ligase-1